MLNHLRLSRPQLSRPQLSRPQLSRPQLSRPQLSRPQLSRPQLSRPQPGRPRRPNLGGLLPLLAPLVFLLPVYVNGGEARRPAQIGVPDTGLAKTSQKSLTTEQKIKSFSEKLNLARTQIQNHGARIAEDGTIAEPKELTAVLDELRQDFGWSVANQKELRSRHARQIDRARIVALKSSKKWGISLDRVRQDRAADSFCADLPKGGMLHVHPWGTLDLETLSLILKTQNPLIDTAQLQTLAENGLDENADGKIDATLPKGAATAFIARARASAKAQGDKIRYADLSIEEKKMFHDLFFIETPTSQFSEFMGVFSVIFNVVFQRDMTTDPKFKVDEVMWAAFLTRAQREKISYLEVTQTVNPKFGVEKFSYLKKLFKEKYGITLNTLAAFDRRQPPEKIMAQLKDILTLPASDAIVGINLVANEDLHPALDFKNTYGLFGIKRQSTHPQLAASIHAGEKGDPFNVRHALAMGVQRIGHGVMLKDDMLALEYVRRNRVPIEINVLSNLRLGVSPSLKEHPFLNFQRLGIPVSLSTDDEGIFKTSLSRECAEIIDQTDIQYAELRSMIMNSIETSFAAPAEKKEALANLTSALSEFEKKMKAPKK